MTPLEASMRALFDFLQTARNGVVLNMPYEKGSLLSYLRLNVNGTWEITATCPDPL